MYFLTKCVALIVYLQRRTKAKKNCKIGDHGNVQNNEPIQTNLGQCINLASASGGFVNEICNTHSLFAGTEKSNKRAKLVTTITTKILNQFKPN